MAEHRITFFLVVSGVGVGVVGRVTLLLQNVCLVLKANSLCVGWTLQNRDLLLFDFFFFFGGGGVPDDQLSALLCECRIILFPHSL